MVIVKIKGDLMHRKCLGQCTVHTKYSMSVVGDGYILLLLSSFFAHILLFLLCSLIILLCLLSAIERPSSCQKVTNCPSASIPRFF